MSIAETIAQEIENLNLPQDETLQAITKARQALANLAVEQVEGTTFYRAVFTVEVLMDSKVDIGNWSLADIEQEITDGQFSGFVELDAFHGVSADDMEVLLASQGSAPEFFGLGIDREDEDNFDA